MLGSRDTGLAVKQAQCRLNSVLDRRVTADGIIGPKIWAALDNW